MLGVKHIHPSHHADSHIRSICNLSYDVLHKAQNDIWVLVDTITTSYPIILIAHQKTVLPTPEVEIDCFRYTGIGTKPDHRRIDELVYEFLGDKRNKIIYAPEDIEDNELILSLVNHGFLFDATTDRYTKVPYNY